ncbi:MAG: hypothetical protein NVSMB2_25250 [Chloroflexota bacterium]
MVLDAKALTWAAQHDIDTAKLKKAHVPIYGKWYFPEIPPGLPLVNLETGEQHVFPERMIAGEVIYVPVADLVRAGLVPETFVSSELSPEPAPSERGMRTIAPEPLLAMARPPGYEFNDTPGMDDDPDTVLAREESAAALGIHMPSPSIAPFILGLGFCIALMGAIIHPIIFIVGLAWILAGAIGWIRIGVLEYRAAHAPHVVADGRVSREGSLAP